MKSPTVSSAGDNRARRFVAALDVDPATSSQQFLLGVAKQLPLLAAVVAAGGGAASARFLKEHDDSRDPEKEEENEKSGATAAVPFARQKLYACHDCGGAACIRPACIAFASPIRNSVDDYKEGHVHRRRIEKLKQDFDGATTATAKLQNAFSISMREHAILSGYHTKQ